MDKAAAQALALEKMGKHGLIAKGWRFAFNKRKSALGLCSFKKKTIFLSEIYVSLNSEESVLDTILHEIAHALAGAKAGHGLAWKLACEAIGARPQRCACEKVAMPMPKYRLAIKLPDGSLELTNVARNKRADMSGRQMRGRPETKNKLIWIENKA